MEALARAIRPGGVEWRDLRVLSASERARELVLGTPWLAASLILAQRRLWPAALACSFYFFLCGLRRAHDAFHAAAGLGRKGSDVQLFLLSVAMGGSLHAVRWNHLRHHRFCLGAGDVEGGAARGSAWRALLDGPRFPLQLHVAAWRSGSRRVRSWMAAELAAGAALIAVAVGVPACPALRYHVLVMSAGQCLTAFFAVWTVHHGVGRGARTVRGALRARAFYHMFFHLEHHLYPAVPARHLPRLAARLDRAAPGLPLPRVL